MSTVDTVTPRESHAASVAEVARVFETDLERGLPVAEAAARLRRHGPNRLETVRGPGVLIRLLAQVRDPLIYVLLLAGLSIVTSGGCVSTVNDRSLLDVLPALSIASM